MKCCTAEARGMLLSLTQHLHAGDDSVAIHGRMYTVAAVNAAAKTIIAASGIISPAELNTGAWIWVYDPTGRLLGSTYVVSVGYVNAPSGLLTTTVDSVFQTTFSGYSYLQVRALERQPALCLDKPAPQETAASQPGAAVHDTPVTLREGCSPQTTEPARPCRQANHVFNAHSRHAGLPWFRVVVLSFHPVAGFVMPSQIFTRDAQSPQACQSMLCSCVSS